MYDDFYRFVANAYDKPKYRLHFRTDAPIDLKVKQPMFVLLCIVYCVLCIKANISLCVD
jgi:hypothetical protein